MTTLTRTPGKAVTIVAWTLQILCAATFVFAGGSKLVGVPAMVKTFETIGVGQWFRYVTSAALLLVPSLAFFGALALVATMVGAVITHLFIVGGSPAPAIVLLAATATIAWLRRPASLR